MFGVIDNGCSVHCKDVCQMSKRKVHPNSLKNLIHKGRPLAVGESKKPRQLTVSKTGWEGTVSVAGELGGTGV